MELRDLVGKHTLSGVDRITEEKRDRWDDHNPEVLRFELDGVLYGAVEDPNDGYRSAMRELKVYKGRPANTFDPVQVEAVYRERYAEQTGWSVEACDLLDLVYNDQVILSVGTRNTDDYYPFFVAYWNPEPLGMVNNTGA